MSGTLIIAGSGPSAVQYEWPIDTSILCVSGGCDVVPNMDHFCALDKPLCFPRWLRENDEIKKHVPNWTYAEFWKKWPCVKVWPYEDAPDPTFHADRPIASGPLLKSNVPAPRHNSLLFAVQLAPRIGFDRCLFIGCDLLLDGLLPVSDVLRDWHGAAQDAGLEWVNLSPLSTLCEWMPTEPAILREVMA